MTQAKTSTATRRTAHSPSEELGSVFVSNYPPYSVWSPDQVPAAFDALSQPSRDAADFGLYLHIPFCRKRCKFCYFRVYTDKNFDEIGGYLDALAREIELAAELPALAGRRPRFVYFGGGTPSFISVKQLRTLVERVRAVFPWDEAQEITFECEPGTLTRSKLEAIREIGVTRLSLGVENFDAGILKLNGRAHEAAEIWRCLPWIEELEFDQVNFDLIAGMLGETWDTWRETVAQTVDLAPDSVTIYQMELPFNSRFAQSIIDGAGLEAPLPEREVRKAWHDHAFAELEAAGYTISSAYTVVRRDRDHPERSRFLYRDSLWHGGDMLGTGVASFSHVGGVHFQNVDGWDAYQESVGRGELPFGRAHLPSQAELLTRELILQLKLGSVSAGYFREKFGVDVLDAFEEPFRRLAERDMLTTDDGTVHLTRQGLLQVDDLLSELYDPRYADVRYT